MQAGGGSPEPQSLEYIEDPYFIKLESHITPSLDEEVDDECDSGSEAEAWSRLSPQLNANVDLHDDSLLCVETEFVTSRRRGRLLIFRKKIRDVRVTFQDLSKPYIAKISSHNNYKKFLGLATGVDEAAPISPGEEALPELIGLTPEQIEQQKAEWSQELARVEDEISTLRLVLASKIRVSSELKRKLGISAWKEFADDMNQSIKNVKESHVYNSVEKSVGQITKVVTDTPVFQKTESVIKTTAEKTTSLFGGLTSKLGQMRNSESFRSFEEKMGSAYENVKGKVVSRSNSEQNFDECMGENRDRRKSQPVATSPTIPENVPLP